MKTLILAFLISTGAFADSVFTPGYSLNETDKAAHFAFGFAAGMATQYFLLRVAPESTTLERSFAGLVVSLGLGILKEHLDEHRDGHDVHATMVGGITAGLIVLPLDLF